jgi:1-acyl-sn-glycerol-3-phosphate acyltransferase
VITPEGTRSWVPKWRKGFYHMALAAKVPMYWRQEILKKNIVSWATPFPTKELHRSF